LEKILKISIFLHCRITSLGTFGAAGGLTVLYMTDWKAVLKFVPFYGSKFPVEEEEKK
jgi:Ubiquinol-cytochrome C reductase complex, 6.4kD protein